MKTGGLLLYRFEEEKQAVAYLAAAIGITLATSLTYLALAAQPGADQEELAAGADPTLMAGYGAVTVGPAPTMPSASPAAREVLARPHGEVVLAQPAPPVSAAPVTTLPAPAPTPVSTEESVASAPAPQTTTVTVVPRTRDLVAAPTTLPARLPDATRSTLLMAAPLGPMQPTTTLSPRLSLSSTGGASWFRAPRGTCAHRTLPFGTMVTVRRTDNGATTQCRVNDRGPFIDNRVIDLSEESFSELAPLSSGVVPVNISW